jgi:putative transcriptional regulator
MKKERFNILMESTRQAVEHAEGKRRDLRTTLLPMPPAPMPAKEIVALRESLNCSQAVFAKLMNISVKTVQSWEYEINEPSGAALKLLTLAKKYPEVLLR